MNILALDLGLKTGWAVCLDGQVESGMENFKPHRDESRGTMYLKFRTWLAGVLNGAEKAGQRIEWIFYEKAFKFLSGQAYDVHVGMKTRIQEICDLRGIEYKGVNPTTLKIFATGKGNCPKAAMIEKAKKIYPAVAIVDDNHADALLLLKYARERFDK